MRVSEKRKQHAAVADASATAYLSFAKFRMALRQNRIDATSARRLFRRHYSKLGDICKREGCTLQRARTINAILEGEVNAALLKDGRAGILKTYQSVDELLKELQS